MKKFFSGILIYTGIISLNQDFMGKENYIEWANTHWIDAKITIPIAICFILIGLLLLINKIEIKKDE